MSWKRRRARTAKAELAGWILFITVILAAILLAVGFLKWDLEQDQKKPAPVEVLRT